jgi:hypothetical protein
MTSIKAEPETACAAIIALERDLVAAERLQEQHYRAHETEHTMLIEAIELARLGMDRRLDGMNAFRQQLERAEQQFVPRGEWETKYDALSKAWETKHDALSKETNIRFESSSVRVQALERLLWIASGMWLIISAVAMYIVKKGL